MTKRGRHFRPFLLVLLVALGVWTAVNAVSGFLGRPLALGSQRELEVERGSTLGEVARRLGRDGVLAHPLWLLAYARFAHRGHEIHSGDYLLEPGTTPLDLLVMLERGKVRTFDVTFVEGWTLAQARAMLAGEKHLRHVVADVPASQLLAALDIRDAPDGDPEGLFFPDTYVFSGQTSDRDILRQAYRRMREVLTQEWAGRAEDLPYQSPYEALIMASIVEKETGAPQEREAIAGVFVRRLRKGMLLQTDPTVIYGMGARFHGNLRRRDLEDRDNPYNTYQHRGLPPTPIALPGRAAIHAALHPAAGDALYFVARGDGTHQFSATLAEHDRAVRQYQVRHRRADYRSRPEPAAAADSARARQP